MVSDYGFIIEYRDEEFVRRQVKYYGKYVDSIVYEFKRDYPDAKISGVYKEIVRDWSKAK